MKRILFSACCRTYMQQRACEGLVRLLKDGDYEVDVVGNVNKESWPSYDLVVAFNKRGYDKIQELHTVLPIVYAILADDYGEEFIDDTTQYETMLLIAPEKDACYSNVVTPLHFPCVESTNSVWKLRHTKPTVLVDAGNSRSVLRAFIVLNTLAQYTIDMVYSGKQELYGVGYATHVAVREDFEVDTLIQNAQLVIGSRYAALQGALNLKPVIVLGDYGSGGLLTSTNVIDQYRNNFMGKINGEREEYFPLESFQQEIKSALKVPLRELEKISTLLKREMLENQAKLCEAIRSCACGRKL